MASPLLHSRIDKAKEQAQREHFRNQLASSFKHDPEQNNVDVFVLSAEEVIELWLAKQRSRGQGNEQINARYQELLGNENVELIKSQGINVAGLARDSKNIAVLMRDFKRSGNVLGRYTTSVRAGRKYIIFKGNHKLREIIRGTRYTASNPMIMKLGIGLRGATTLVKGSMVVTLIVSPLINSLSWLFDPKFGWQDFLKGMASDLVLAFLAAVAGALVAGILSLSVSTVVLPIVAGLAVMVGTGVTLGIMNLDGSLTDAMIDSAVKTYEYLSSEVEQFYYYIFDRDTGHCSVRKADPRTAEELQGRTPRIGKYSPRASH